MTQKSEALGLERAMSPTQLGAVSSSVEQDENSRL